MTVGSVFVALTDLIPCRQAANVPVMRVLVSPGDNWLGKILIDGLSSHEAVPDVDPQIDTNLGARQLDYGFEAVVLMGPLEGVLEKSLDASSILDQATRLNYDLLCSSVRSGTRRCVYLSTLRLMSGHPSHYTVTEGWRPLPMADEPALLGCHLGEQIVLEFAREHRIEVVTVRLGYPIVAGSRSALTSANGGAAICTDDVVAAVEAALTAPVSKAFTLAHIQSPVPGARYLMQQASDLLGFPETVSK